MSIVISDSKTTPRARRRAAATTWGFGLWGIFLAFFVGNWHTAWPLVLFYALLVLNTYFSVRTFASITPKEHLGQQFVDILLGCCLILLPLYFERPLIFVLIMTALFIIATLKYIFLVPVAGYSKLLYRKIRIDTLGILFCFLALLGILFGYSYWTTVLWVVIFFGANAQVILWQPLYNLRFHDNAFL